MWLQSVRRSAAAGHPFTRAEVQGSRGSTLPINSPNVGPRHRCSRDIPPVLDPTNLSAGHVFTAGGTRAARGPQLLPAMWLAASLPAWQRRSILGVRPSEPCASTLPVDYHEVASGLVGLFPGDGPLCLADGTGARDDVDVGAHGHRNLQVLVNLLRRKVLGRGLHLTRDDLLTEEAEDVDLAYVLILDVHVSTGDEVHDLDTTLRRRLLEVTSRGEGGQHAAVGGPIQQSVER